MFLVPVLAFFALIIYGLAVEELSAKTSLVLVGIWAAFRLGFSAMGIPSYAAIAVDALLDIFLVLRIFGGDIRPY